MRAEMGTKTDLLVQGRGSPALQVGEEGKASIFSKKREIYIFMCINFKILVKNLFSFFCIRLGFKLRASILQSRRSTKVSLTTSGEGEVLLAK
jgi:hypothetical protein